MKIIYSLHLKVVPQIIKELCRSLITAGGSFEVDFELNRVIIHKVTSFALGEDGGYKAIYRIPVKTDAMIVIQKDNVEEFRLSAEVEEI